MSVDGSAAAGTWERSPGLPNVAVYELDLAGDGESVLAATHGRGVWRFSAAPLARVHAVSGGASSISPVITVAAAGFDPNQSCTLTLLEGNRTCGTSAVDAAGAGLSTDGQGFLVSAGRSLSWVCKGGVCASSGPCGVSAVRVTCGGRAHPRRSVRRSWPAHSLRRSRVCVGPTPRRRRRTGA